jgi:hypothetical protein
MLGTSLFRTGNVGRSGTEFYRFAVVAGSDRLCCGAYRVTEFYRFAFTPGPPLPLGLLYCGYQWANSLGSGNHPRACILLHCAFREPSGGLSENLVAASTRGIHSLKRTAVSGVIFLFGSFR